MLTAHARYLLRKQVADVETGSLLVGAFYPPSDIEVLPNLLGVGALKLPKIRGRKEAVMAGKRQPEAVLKAATEMVTWANENRIPMGKSWQAMSETGMTGQGAMLNLPSENDRVQAALQARVISRKHNTFYRIVESSEPGETGWYLFYFTDDPAGFSFTTAGPSADAVTSGFYGVEGGFFSKLKESLKGSPEKRAERIRRKIEALRDRIKKLEEKLGDTETSGFLTDDVPDEFIAQGFEGFTLDEIPSGALMPLTRYQRPRRRWARRHPIKAAALRRQALRRPAPIRPMLRRPFALRRPVAPPPAPIRPFALRRRVPIGPAPAAGPTVITRVVERPEEDYGYGEDQATTLAMLEAMTAESKAREAEAQAAMYGQQTDEYGQPVQQDYYASEEQGYYPEGQGSYAASGMWAPGAYPDAQLRFPRASGEYPDAYGNLYPR